MTPQLSGKKEVLHHNSLNGIPLVIWTSKIFARCGDRLGSR